MPYTVSDFVNSHSASVRLLAGQGGFSRPIDEVGILDYELVPGLKSRYQRTNFYEGQLVLSTFLYARDNPYLIIDAVKYLVSVGASALVIKNVFRLEIPDAALRFANARNLPVLLVTDDRFYFDEVILEVGLRVHELVQSAFAQREIDALLDERDDQSAVLAHAQRLNPSFDDELAALYVLSDGGLDRSAALERLQGMAGVRDLICGFDQGILAVITADPLTAQQVERAFGLLQERLLDVEDVLCIGVSEIHQGISSLALVILEAIHAARIAELKSQPAVSYRDLGTLRALLPHATSPAMRSFERQVMEPLRDFDTEHTASLEHTLTVFLESDRSLARTAEALGTHPNTIRYRMKQIQQVTGLDWQRPQDMEQLSLAHAIALAREVAWQ